jgi:hypothetical protein
MYARVVRFTEVDPDHLAERLADVEASEGPPVDIPAKGIQILHDSDQRTAVVIQLFETADDMAQRRDPSTRWTRETRRGRAPRSTAAKSRPNSGSGDGTQRSGTSTTRKPSGSSNVRPWAAQ